LNGLGAAAKKNESVVGVLKNGARGAIYKGMAKMRRENRVMKEAPENIGDDDEKIGGQGISLSKASTAADPFPGNAVQEDSRLPRLEE
jgi:hypothetical protein